MKNKEKWVLVKETNGLYKISNLGNIFSTRSGKYITYKKSQVYFQINKEIVLDTKIELIAKHFEVEDFSITKINKQTPKVFFTIIDKVMRYYNLDEKTLFSETRNRYVVTARQMIFKLSKELSHYSLSNIGKYLNTKDHQMPAYSVKNINQLIEVNKDIKRDYEQLLHSIDTTVSNYLCKAIEELIPL